jgi:hypothetical protein
MSSRNLINQFLHYKVLNDKLIARVHYFIIFLTLSSFIIDVILTEICSINKQKNYNKVFRSQEKEILVSFNGTMVLKFLITFCFLYS